MGMTWRSMTVADAAAWAELWAEVEAVDRTGENFSEQDLREELSDEVLDLARATTVAFDGERMIACGVVRIGSSADQLHRVSVHGAVHPKYRRQGLGVELVRWSIATATELHRERFPGVPLEVHTAVDEHNYGKVRLWRAVGFAPVRWFFQMQCALTPAAPPAELPAGLRLMGYHARLDNKIRLACNEAFEDHYAAEPFTEAGWRQWITGSHVFRPELSYVVLDEADRVAGILIAQHYPADAQATGVPEIWVADLGTRRPWRHQGVAGALLRQVLVAAGPLGYQRAALEVDADNPTGALRLYRQLGFTERQKVARYARTVLLS